MEFLDPLRLDFSTGDRNGSICILLHDNNGTGTTVGSHVEECELINSYLLVLRSNLSGSRNST